MFHSPVTLKYKKKSCISAQMKTPKSISSSNKDEYNQISSPVFDF